MFLRVIEKYNSILIVLCIKYDIFGRSIKIYRVDKHLPRKLLYIIIIVL